jgi:hypothetical protein
MLFVVLAPFYVGFLGMAISSTSHSVPNETMSSILDG